MNLLKSIYLEGLRYNKIQNNEIVVGANATAKIPQVEMICFTELKLTNAKRHIEHYGPMGIGFRRDWLMKCGANPVFYMQNRNEGVVNTNLSIVSSHVGDIPGLKVFPSFIKPMSEQNKKELIHYDEFEWRMVLCKLNNKYSDWIKLEGNTPYFRFPPEKVSIIVFPNEETRKLILNDDQMDKYFNKHIPMIIDADDCDQF